jgi:hypothetical protein
VTTVDNSIIAVMQRLTYEYAKNVVFRNAFSHLDEAIRATNALLTCVEDYTRQLSVDLPMKEPVLAKNRRSVVVQTLPMSYAILSGAWGVCPLFCCSKNRGLTDKEVFGSGGRRWSIRAEIWKK